MQLNTLQTRQNRHNICNNLRKYKQNYPHLQVGKSRPRNVKELSHYPRAKYWSSNLHVHHQGPGLFPLLLQLPCCHLQVGELWSKAWNKVNVICFPSIWGHVFGHPGNSRARIPLSFVGSIEYTWSKPSQIWEAIPAGQWPVEYCNKIW